MEVFYGILIPFLGTALGASCVFFMKKSLNDGIQRMLAGFAAGVMVAASIWSLFIPAMNQSQSMDRLSFIPAAAGFWMGILFLLAPDHIIPHLHQNSKNAEGPKVRLKRTTMMVLAVTLHNIPEGMAVGVPYLLSFAAGAMLYVVVEELIPEISQGDHSHSGPIFFALGFSLMMILDVALGQHTLLPVICPRRVLPPEAQYSLAPPSAQAVCGDFCRPTHSLSPMAHICPLHTAPPL